MSYHYKLVIEIIDDGILFDAVDDMAISIGHLNDCIEQLTIADDELLSVDSAHTQSIRGDIASIMDETVKAKEATLDMLFELLKKSKYYLGEVVSVKEAGEFHA